MPTPATTASLPNRSLPDSGTIIAPTGPGDAKQIPGGYRGLPATKGEAVQWLKSSHGSAGSLNKSLPKGNSISSVVTETPTPTPKVADVISGGLDIDVAKFNSDVDEVTINSAYYSTEQPLLARMILQFPKQIDEIGTVTTSTTNAIPDTSSVINISKTVSSVSPELSATFNNITPEEDYLEVRPNNFLGLDFNRIYNGFGTFTITLFDPKWDAIEKRLNKNKGFFRFKYGYLDGGPNAVSPWYVAKSFHYNSVFSMEGSTITISGITQGYSLNFTKHYKAMNLKNELISDIAKAICGDLGPDYIPVIEETLPVTSRDGMLTTDSINKIFNLTAETYFKVIIEQLCKYARNKDGQGNYTFFIRPNLQGKNEFHFHTINYDPTKGTTVSGKTTPGFTQFRNKNQALISFTPSWALSIAQLTGGGGTTSAIIDTNNKDFSSYNANMETNPQKMDGNSKFIMVMHPEEGLPKEDKGDNKIIAFKIPITADRSADQNKASVQAEFSRSYPGAIKATLVIFGTPNFYLTQKIAVFVFRPQSNNLEATVDNVHWISGFFRIIGIRDSISLGKFTTTFDLVSDGRSRVAPDAVKTIQSN